MGMSKVPFLRTGLRAVLHVRPVALPLLAPGEVALADRAGLGGQVLLVWIGHNKFKANHRGHKDTEAQSWSTVIVTLALCLRALWTL